jgi:hypothetical protein
LTKIRNVHEQRSRPRPPWAPTTPESRVCGLPRAEKLARRHSQATNRSALASSWRSAGRIVGVEWHGQIVFPAFQFDAEAHPRAPIARVLSHLRDARLGDWQQVLCFTTRTGWLNDRRPLDVIDSDPAAVVAAAAAFHDRPT